MENIPLLMTIPELHRLIGRERIGRDALYQLARKHGVRLGKKLLIPRRVVLALLEGRLDELEARNPAGAGGER
jgi:hypothetical protein